MLIFIDEQPDGKYVNKNATPALSLDEAGLYLGGIKMAKDCTCCKHAIFNEMWGEYKCKIVQHKVVPVIVACSSYEKGEPTISKDDEVMEEE